MAIKMNRQTQKNEGFLHFPMHIRLLTIDVQKYWMKIGTAELFQCEMVL